MKQLRGLNSWGVDQVICVGDTSAQSTHNKDVQAGVWVRYGMDMFVFYKGVGCRE